MKSRLKRATAMILALVLIMCSSSFIYAAEKLADSVSARNAIVQEVTGTGTTQIIRNSNQIQAAKGIRLQAGDRLKTSQDAKIYINIDGKSVIRLDEQSEAEISNALFGKIRINLIVGRLFYNIAKTTDGNESLEFMSNNITIAIRGTSGMLGYGNGAVESILFDGAVTAVVNGVSVEQKPAEEIFFKAEPGKPVQECITRKEITLNDIPVSVIAEMQKDPTLKEKIVKSVPAGKDAAGNPIFGDINTDITNIGKADNTMLPYSAPAKPQTSSSSGSGGSYTPKPAPEPAKILCPHCGAEVSSVDAHSEGTCKGGCGQTLYSCMTEAEKKLHEIRTCPETQLIEYCSQNEEAVDLHEHMCDCGETYCVNLENAKKILGTSTHLHHCECGNAYCINIPANINTHQHKCTSSGDYFIGCGKTYCIVKEGTHEIKECQHSGCNKSYCAELDNIDSVYTTYACREHSGCVSHAADHASKGFICEYCKATIYKCNEDRHGNNCPEKPTTETNAPLRSAMPLPLKEPCVKTEEQIEEQTETETETETEQELHSETPSEKATEEIVG